MTTLTSFTSYAEIRAVLGVSATELPDTVLAQSQWATMLSIELEDLHVGLEALYLTYSGASTGNALKLYNLTRLYSSYVVAKILLSTLSMFSAQTLTDGRASFTRHPDMFTEVREGVAGMLQALKLKLSAAYVVLVPAEEVYARSSFDYSTSTGLSISPITNA